MKIKHLLIYYIQITALVIFCPKSNGQIVRTNIRIAPIQISGKLLNSKNDIDTLTIKVLSQFGSGNLYRTADSSITVTTEKHNFRFNFFPQHDFIYISLQIGSSDWQGAEEMLTQVLIKNGDNVNIIYDCRTKKMSFSGKGSEKLTWYKKMELNDVRLRDSLPKYIFDRQPAQWIGNENFRLNYHINSLQSLKKGKDDTTYSILRADLTAQNRFYIYDLMRAWNFGIEFQRPQLDSIYKKDFYKKTLDTNSSDLLTKSGCYAIFMVNKLNTDNAYREAHHYIEERTVYNIIKDSYATDLRDKMLVTLLYKKYAFQELSDSLLSDAILTMKNTQYVKVLENLQGKIGKGQQVIGLTFTDRFGNKFDLINQLGKVILVDMWFTGCAGCIQVAKALPKVEDAFRGNKNVAFVSLSIDKNKQTWLKSISADLSHPGDHYTTKTSLYLYTNGTGYNNEFIKRYNATSGYPRLILIDKKGAIYSFNPPRPDEPGGSEQLIRLINEALRK